VAVDDERQGSGLRKVDGLSLARGVLRGGGWTPGGLHAALLLHSSVRMGGVHLLGCDRMAATCVGAYTHQCHRGAAIRM